MPSDKALKISGLKVSRGGRKTIRGLDLTLPAGKLHILMGPNGSGKSSLANALMGHPDYEITAGRVSLNGKNLLKLAPDGRSLAGLFLSPQVPPEVPGGGLASVLRTAVNRHRSPSPPLDAVAFRDRLLEAMAAVGLPPAFADRNLNQGFSGGERKRCELLQMVLLQPRFAVLDEIDSGLDVDGLQAVVQAITAVRRSGTGILLITHYDRLLKFLRPDRVHLLVDGAIVKTGGRKLAEEISRVGFKKFVVGMSGGRVGGKARRQGRVGRK